MTKQETISYVSILAFLIALCMALSYFTRHMDHLAYRYNKNKQSTPISQIKSENTLPKQGKSK